jgi:hypothetical protein
MLINTSYKLVVAKDYQHKSLIVIPSSFLKKINQVKPLTIITIFPTIVDKLMIVEPLLIIKLFFKQNECQYETLQSHQMNFKNKCLTFFKC